MSKLRIDWDEWFSHTRLLPQACIRDEKTGLQRLATSKKAYEKYKEIMCGELGRAEEAEAQKTAEERVDVRNYPGMVDAETLDKYMLEGLRMALLDDDEFYALHPELWEEHGVVIKE